MSTSEYYAQKTLLTHNITKLPVEADTIIDMIRSYKYNVKCIENCKENLKDVLTELNMYNKLKDKCGYSININNLKTVFYSKSLTLQQQTEVLAHELAHIVLNHISDNGVLGYSNNITLLDSQEKEADDFARELLAPACVINKRCRTLEEIKNYTLLSDENAKIQYTQSRKYKCRTDTERELIKKFQIKPANNHLLAYIVAIIITVIAIFGCISILSTPQMPTPDSLPGYCNTQDSDSDAENLHVYKALHGTVYHKNTDCHYIKGKDNISEITLKTAESMDLRPCSYCYRNNK